MGLAGSVAYQGRDMSWLPKIDKLDPVQAAAINVAAVVSELI